MERAGFGFTNERLRRKAATDRGSRPSIRQFFVLPRVLFLLTPMFRRSKKRIEDGPNSTEFSLRTEIWRPKLSRKKREVSTQTL